MTKLVENNVELEAPHEALGKKGEIFITCRSRINITRHT